MTVAEIISIALGVIGVVVGIIGCLNLSKANKLTSKEITGSTIQQAESITTINYGTDTYAMIKIAKDVSKEELEKIIEPVLKAQNEIADIRKTVNNMPRIRLGAGNPPSDLKNGDIYLQYK